MDNSILFEETQRFKQWWLWLILIFIPGTNLVIAVKQIGFGQLVGNNPMSNTGVLIGFVVSLLLILLFIFIKLETKITNEGISVRFFPFHLNYKFYKWEDIKYSYVRKYSPLLEYGGWGIRHSFTRGKAYNISGNMGIQIEFNNDKKILIGTNQPEKVKMVLNSIDKYKEVL